MLSQEKFITVYNALSRAGILSWGSLAFCLDTTQSKANQMARKLGLTPAITFPPSRTWKTDLLNALFKGTLNLDEITGKTTLGFNQYQEFTGTTAIYQEAIEAILDPIQATILGDEDAAPLADKNTDKFLQILDMAGEVLSLAAGAGLLSNLAKKAIRDDNPPFRFATMDPDDEEDPKMAEVFQYLKGVSVPFPGRKELDRLIQEGGTDRETEEVINQMRQLLCQAYLVMGLVGESAETAVNFLQGQPSGKELGDTLYYLAQSAKYEGIPLEEVAQTNMKKLQDRQNRGTIQGSGDER
jgi:NTP pyrophosphatase (non-canonical NTP hydrolase)